MKPEHVPSGNGFDRLTLNNWRQFGQIDIDFHSRLTVLTGANASGKTTILNILGRHFDWQPQFLSVPQWKAGGLDWMAEQETNSVVGNLSYWDGRAATVNYSISNQAEAQLHVQPQAPMRGLFISSHRMTGRYQKLVSIPAEFSAVALIYKQFFDQILTRYTGSWAEKTPQTVMKESLLAAALYGGDGQQVERNPAAATVWSGFQDALRKSLPQSFGFERLTIRAPEIVVVTSRGEFLIDAVSGGISAIMELTWQIYLRSWESENFTVCMDEPENHLHPSLQRSLIPGLLEAFPTISFVVATHSPFIVTSVADSHVYVLAPVDDDPRSPVFSILLDTANKSATADETLRRVLGVPVTIPIWAENVLERLMESIEGESFAGKVQKIQLALSSLGLEDQLPAALDALEDDESGA